MKIQLRKRLGLDRAMGRALAGALLLVVSSLPFTAQAQDATVVKEGLQRGALGALKAVLPEIQGKYGLKYDIKIFNDSTSVILAMDQKELDVGNITAQHVVRAIDQGIEMVVVAGWGGGYNVLVAREGLDLPEKDLKAFKALAAKKAKDGEPLKIGVPTGSQQHLKLIYLLQQNEIDAKSVQIVNVPFPSQPRAISGGEVDLVMTIAPFAALSIATGKGKLVHHVYGANAGKWEIGFAVRKDLVENKPELVQKIVDSHVAALKSFMSDVAKQVELESQKTSLPKNVIEMVQKEFLRLTFRIPIEDIKRTAREMKEVGWVKKDLSGEVDKYVDYSFLKKATGESEERLKQF